MYVTLLVLGPPNVEGDRLLTEAQGLLSSLRERLGSKHELNVPGAVQGGTLYMGQYEALRRIGTRVSELIGGKPRPDVDVDPFEDGVSQDDMCRGRSMFLSFPFTWEVRVRLVIGRRDWGVVERRDTLMEQEGFQGTICSYDRLSDESY